MAYGIKAIQPSSADARPHILGFTTARATAGDTLLEVWNGGSVAALRAKLDLAGRWLVGAGTAPLPGLSFTADPASGIYSPAVGAVGLSVAGAEVARLVSQRLLVGAVAAGASGVGGAVFAGAVDMLGGFAVAGTTVVSAARVLQNVTASASILTSGILVGVTADASIINTGVFGDAHIPNLEAARITSGTFATARISQASVTQHQAALALAASQVTSGTFADARISAASVTQHQAALSIAPTQIPTGTFPGVYGITGRLGVGVAADAAIPLLVSKAVAGNYAAKVRNETVTAGQSPGLFVQAGTSSGDFAIVVNNAANTLTLFGVLGNGDTQVRGLFRTIAGGMRAEGATAPTGGEGLELLYDPNLAVAYIQSYNRTGAAYQQMEILSSFLRFYIGGAEIARITDRLYVGTTVAGSSTAGGGKFNGAVEASTFFKTS